MPVDGWSHFHHQADIGVRGEGETLAQAFANAAMAMSAVITEPELIQPESPLTIRCEAPEAELLLVDFLNAIIFEMATRHMLFSRFDVLLEQNHLTATIWGERVDIARHQPAVEIKGASYTALKVEKMNGHWLAQCVVDV